MLGKNFSRHFKTFFFLFSYFSYKIGFDISCKLSPVVTICTKCQILFYMKNKKTFYLLLILPRENLKLKYRLTNRDTNQPAHGRSLARALIPATRFYGIQYYNRKIAETLVSFHWYAGWSGSLQFVYALRSYFLDSDSVLSRLSQQLSYHNDLICFM